MKRLVANTGNFWESVDVRSQGNSGFDPVFSRIQVSERNAA